MDRPCRTGGFVVQGHRGARGLFPENTLAGFAGAVALGVTSLELDIAVTADLVPVVVHDPVLDPALTRNPDGTWLDEVGLAVSRLTLAALRRFDVGRARGGSATAIAFPAQTPSDGERVPTLAEVFAATAASGIRIEAELKTDPRRPDLTLAPERMADLVVAVARDMGALGRLAVRSFDWRGLKHLRTACPDLPLAWLTDAETERESALWWDRAAGGSTAGAVAAEAGSSSRWQPVWAPAHAGLLRQQVAEAHGLGLLVVPWTVNDPADMTRLIDWGVDGLCTDRPDLAFAAVAEAGLPVPTPDPALGVRRA